MPAGSLRLATAMNAAIMPTPIGIVSQSDIVSLLRYASESSCQQKGQGTGPVNQAGRQAYLHVFAGSCASPLSGRRLKASAGECATACSSFIGEQFVYVSTVCRPYLRRRP